MNFNNICNLRGFNAGVLITNFGPWGGLCALPLSTAQICHGTLVRRALYISLDWYCYVQHVILCGDIQ